MRAYIEAEGRNPGRGHPSPLQWQKAICWKETDWKCKEWENQAQPLKECRQELIKDGFFFFFIEKQDLGQHKFAMEPVHRSLWLSPRSLGRLGEEKVDNEGDFGWRTGIWEAQYVKNKDSRIPDRTEMAGNI